MINELSDIEVFCLLLSEPKTLANKLLNVFVVFMESEERWHGNLSPLEMLLNTKKAEKENGDCVIIFLNLKRLLNLLELQCKLLIN